MRYDDIFAYPKEWLTDADAALAASCARWADKEVMAKRLEHREDHERLLTPATKSLLADIGLQRLVFPEDRGGAGVSDPAMATTMTTALEQIARGDVGIAHLLANTLALQAAIGVGPSRDEARLAALAERFCGAEPCLVALVLPAYGDGAAHGGPALSGLTCQVKATRRGNDWALSGSARPQSAGGDASLFAVVAAFDDGAPGLFILPGDVPGVRRGPCLKKTGLAADRNADLTFDAVVSADALAFAGADRVRQLLAWLHVANAAICVGAGFAAWEILKEWGDTRVIKGRGQVFKENPLTGSLMGEIGGRIAVSRALAYNAARVLARPDVHGAPSDSRVYGALVALTRAVSEATIAALDHTMELMGSAGYATEWNLERYWRDIKTLQTYWGPAPTAAADMARAFFAVAGS
jgi:alkylation response protein AidB-like acyl-CoA dehydrogenase